MTSFNVYGNTTKQYESASVPIWLGTVTPVPRGGTLSKTYIKDNALYSAGTPIQLKDKVITPVLAFVASDVSGQIATLAPVCNIVPEVGDHLYKFTNKFDAASSAAVTKVEKAGDKVKVTVNISGMSNGDILILGNTAVEPNAYLYNDIYIDTAEGASATGAAVMFHQEGILIDRTPASPIAPAMKAAVPYVLQVNG